MIIEWTYGAYAQWPMSGVFPGVVLNWSCAGEAFDSTLGVVIKLPARPDRVMIPHRADLVVLPARKDIVRF